MPGESGSERHYNWFKHSLLGFTPFQYNIESIRQSRWTSLTTLANSSARLVTRLVDARWLCPGLTRLILPAGDNVRCEIDIRKGRQVLSTLGYGARPDSSPSPSLSVSHLPTFLGRTRSLGARSH